MTDDRLTTVEEPLEQLAFALMQRWIANRSQWISRRFHVYTVYLYPKPFDDFPWEHAIAAGGL